MIVLFHVTVPLEDIRNMLQFIDCNIWLGFKPIDKTNKSINIKN